MSNNSVYSDNRLHDELIYNNTDAYTVFEKEPLIPSKTFIVAKEPRSVDSIYPWNTKTLIVLCLKYKVDNVIALVKDAGDVAVHLSSRSIRFTHSHLNLFSKTAKTVVADIVKNIVEHEGNTLIYCRHGINRSGIIYTEMIRHYAEKHNNTDLRYSIPSTITYFNAMRGVPIRVTHLQAYYTKPDRHYDVIHTDHIANMFIRCINETCKRRYKNIHDIKWVLPVSCDINRLSRAMMANVYAITEKADGKRCYVFVYGQSIYLIFRDGMKICCINEYKTETSDIYIFDAEYIEHNDSFCVYVFDIIYSNNNTCIATEDTGKRFACMEKAVGSISVSIIKTKSYIINKCGSIKESMDMPPHDNYKMDGYILIDDKPYWESTLYKIKWDCVVDLYIRSYTVTMSAYCDLITSDNKCIYTSAIEISKEIPDSWLSYNKVLALDGCVGEFVVTLSKDGKYLYTMVGIRNKKANSSMIVHKTIAEHTFTLKKRDVIEKLSSLQ